MRWVRDDPSRRAVRDQGGRDRSRLPALGPTSRRGRHEDADRGRAARGDVGRRGRRRRDLTDEDARRAGAPSLAALVAALAPKADKPAYRVGLRYAGEDPRLALRSAVPDRDELAAIAARLDRLDRASPIGPWTRATLDLVDRNPEVRAPDLAAKVGRETADFKKDVRKLKELGLTESLDDRLPARRRAGRPSSTPGAAAPRKRPPRRGGHADPATSARPRPARCAPRASPRWRRSPPRARPRWPHSTASDRSRSTACREPCAEQGLSFAHG